MINFTRAFDLAWERMVVILFRPFDLGKWMTIGFAAFLAGLITGGNGFNGPYGNWDSKGNWQASYGSSFHSAGPFGNQFTQHQYHYENALPPMLAIPIAIATGLFIFALVLLFYWLGARGQFVFLDNLVRNRGAISLPWRTYARPANGFFGAYLLCLLGIFVIMSPFVAAGLVLFLSNIQAHQWPAGSAFTRFVIFVLLYCAVALPFAAMIFLFRELGLPLMFRRNISVRAAFVETWHLIQRHPGPIFLFLLLRIALFVALAVCSIIVCCGTCVIGGLPYIGTVFLLPALVYIKCFTLDFLAQFGPEYDIWTVDVAPAAAVIPPPPPG